jgi:hypothetical protein
MFSGFSALNCHAQLPARIPPMNIVGLASAQECDAWLSGIIRPITQAERLLAEHPPGATGEADGNEVDSAHDLVANDPTPEGFTLALTHFYRQNLLSFKGVNPHINHNIRDSFSAMLKTTPRSIQETLNAADIKEFLAVHKDRYLPIPENGPTALNTNGEYAGISDRTHGYCWGWSTLVRFFLTLAEYDPSLPKLPSDAHYFALIDQVLRGEVTVFPGYANFRELSLVPKYELYLKLNAMELWKTRAIRFGNIEILRNATKLMTVDEESALIANLRLRLARNEMPKIIFSALVPSGTVLGMNADIHVVLVNGVESLPNGNTRIDLWDINFYAETQVQFPKFIDITPDHQMHYAPWYEPNASYAAQSDLLADIQITPENDAEVAAMIRSKRKYNKAHPKAKTP